MKILEITKIDEYKIFFKSKNSWAMCLNAKQEENSSFSNNYYLKNNNLNLSKLSFLSEISLKKHFNKKENIVKEEKKKLRKYQKEDVDFLSKLKKVCIFSEMRTGKTPVSLMLFKKWKINSLLIISPAIVQKHWSESSEEWVKKPTFIISFLEKEWRIFFYKKILEKKENIVLIVSKETLKIDVDFFIKNKKKKETNYCTIVDEAHFLRNYNSLQSKSVFHINSEYKIAITGTPIVNHNTDIFGILKFIKNEEFKFFWKFAEKYFLIEEFKIKGKMFPIKKIGNFIDKEKKEKIQTLIKSISVNRKQKEVLKWLPKVYYQKEELTMEKKQKKIYFDFKEKWEENPLEMLSKLKSILLFPWSIFDEKEKKEKKLKFEEHKGVKINFIINLLKEFKDNKDNNIIIFSTRSDTFLEPLLSIIKNEKELIKLKVGIITGKTKLKDREKYIELFQEKKINVLLCNIQTSSVGIKLDSADTVIFADRSYSPADNEQAESRFIPTEIAKEIKEIKVKLIIDLVCKWTIDEKIIYLLTKKKENIIEVISKSPKYFFN